MVPVGVGIVRLPMKLMGATYLEIASKMVRGSFNLEVMEKKQDLPLTLMVEPESSRIVPLFASGMSIFWMRPLD
jgi:hypothetical protein